MVDKVTILEDIEKIFQYFNLERIILTYFKFYKIYIN